MSFQVLMPSLWPKMEEGSLTKWFVKEGDAVKSGQVIAEIETEKAILELESEDECIVDRILVAEGTTGVRVNSPIALMMEHSEIWTKSHPDFGRF